MERPQSRQDIIGTSPIPPNWNVPNPAFPNPAFPNPASPIPPPQSRLPNPASPIPPPQSRLPQSRPGDAFFLKLYPIVCQDSTTLQVEGLMSSLIGFQSNGAPRMQTSDIDTRVEINNKASKFVIGGLQKYKSVRNTQQIPFVGQIPGLGFLFSREVEEIAKSQMVIMLECQVLTPTYFTSLVGEDGATLSNKGNDLPQVSIKDLQDLQEMPEKTSAEIVKVKDATGNIKEEGWQSMTHWGFGQWLIDTETTKVEFTNVEL